MKRDLENVLKVFGKIEEHTKKVHSGLEDCDSQSLNLIEHEDDKNKEDLDLLYKLQKVLKAAYVTDKRPTTVPATIKDVTEEVQRKKVTECVSKKKLVGEKVTLPNRNIIEKSIPLPSIKLNKFINIPKKPQFIPAHVSAPFKTDHNIHRPKSRSNSINKTNSSVRSRSAIITEDRKAINKNPQKVVQVRKVSEVAGKGNKPRTCGDIADDVLVEKKGDVLKETHNLFFELNEEIKKLEGGSKGQTIEIKSMQKTLIETRGDLKVPYHLKMECKTRLKLLSKLDSIFLQNMKPETQSKGYKSRQRFLQGVQGGNLVSETDHRLLMVNSVLDDLTGFCGSMNLVSSTPLQVIFVRSCLSWSLQEFLDIQKISPVLCDFKPSLLVTQDCCTISSKVNPVGLVFWENLSKTAYLTNCGFICASPTTRGPRSGLSLVINRPNKSPFRFSTDDSNTPIFVPTIYERRCLQLAIQLQTKIYFGSLIPTWTQELQKRCRMKDRPSSFYRQLYGLLLHKYPVLLQDVS